LEGVSLSAWEYLNRRYLVLQRFVVIHKGEAVGWITAASPEAAMKMVAELSGRPLNELTAAICETPRFRPR